MKTFFKNISTGRLLSLALLVVLIFSIALTNIIAALLLLWFIYKVITDYKNIKFSFPLAIPIMVFALIRIISVFLSVNFSSSVKILYMEIPYYFLIFPLYNFLKDDFEENVITIGKIFKYTSILSSFIGMYIVFSGLSTRAASTSYGFTSLGIYLTVSLIFILFSYGEKKIIRNNIEWYITSAIVIAGIIFTYNRTHWVVMIFLLIFFSVYKKAYLPLIIMLAIGILAFIFIPQIKERLIQIIYIKQFMSDRDTLWKGAWELILVKPFTGFGPNTFTDIFQYQSDMKDKLVGSWHNDYIQIYLESGIFALISFGFIIFNTVYLFFKKNKNFYKPFSLIIFISLIFFFLAMGYLDTMGSVLFKYLLVLFALILYHKKL